MIPFFGQDTVQFLGISFRVWGFFVGCAYALGTFLAYRRAKQKGLNAEQVLSLATWIFFGVMIGARLFHVFVYEPGYYLAEPWEAVDPRAPGFSMMGGLLGALAVFLWRARSAKLDLLAYADVLIWGVPFGCGVGRIGCFLIHDHPGTLTSSLLGVQYPDGQVRHDLGLYLSIAGFLMGAIFLALDKKPRKKGFFVAMYLLLEGFSRVWLDMFRIADTRYAGFTPAQWLGAVFVLVGGAWLGQLVLKERNEYSASI